MAQDFNGQNKKQKKQNMLKVKYFACHLETRIWIPFNRKPASKHLPGQNKGAMHAKFLTILCCLTWLLMAHITQHWYTIRVINPKQPELLECGVIFLQDNATPITIMTCEANCRPQT